MHILQLAHVTNSVVESKKVSRHNCQRSGDIHQRVLELPLLLHQRAACINVAGGRVEQKSHRLVNARIVVDELLHVLGQRRAVLDAGLVELRELLLHGGHVDDHIVQVVRGAAHAAVHRLVAEEAYAEEDAASARRPRPFACMLS